MVRRGARGGGVWGEGGVMRVVCGAWCEVGGVWCDAWGVGRGASGLLSAALLNSSERQPEAGPHDVPEPLSVGGASDNDKAVAVGEVDGESGQALSDHRLVDARLIEPDACKRSIR